MMHPILMTFVMIISIAHGSTKCSIIETCKAVCNGTAIDLSLIMNNHLPLQIIDFANGNRSEEKGFFLAPCQGYPCGGETLNSAVCLETDSDFINCGLVNQTTWYLETINPYRYTLVFTGGENGRQSIIKFIEDLSENGLNSTYVSSKYPTNNNYEFIIKGPCIRPGSCSKSNKPIGIIGSSLLCILGISTVLYLIIGAIIMKRRGAKRLELIPNYTFWKELPHLVADGCLFITSPCCCWKEYAVASYHEIPEANNTEQNEYL